MRFHLWRLITILGCLAVCQSVRSESISGQVTPAFIDGAMAGANFPIAAQGNSGSVIGQSVSGVTDSEGNFSFDVPPGFWAIRLDHKVAPQRGILVPLVFREVSAGQSVSGLRLEVVKPDVMLAGGLSSDTGEPIANVPVFGELTNESGTYSVNTVTSDDGSFSFSVFPGEWYFFASQLPSGFQKPEAQRVAITEDLIAGGFTLDFVSSTAPPGLAIEQTELPDARAGESYSFRLSASGGSQPFEWSAVPDSPLPPQLELAPFTGELRGIPTVSGVHSFDVEVSQLFGSLSGRATLTLQVAADVEPPRILQTNPLSGASIRDNSVIAFHFSEPMRKVTETWDPTRDRLWFRWFRQHLGDEADLERLQFVWNDSGETLFVVDPEPLVQGSNRLTFNPGDFAEDPIADPLEKKFVDASGNLMELSTGRSFNVNSERVVRDDAGNPLRTYRDVEEILLLKERAYSQASGLDDEDLETAVLRVVAGLPPQTWSTVRSASYTEPDGTEHALEYFGFVDSGTTLSETQLYGPQTTLDRGFPNGEYLVTLETFHDGTQSVVLNLEGDQYPTPAFVVEDCLSRHIPADHDYVLKLGNSGDVDIEQLVIHDSRAQKLYSLNVSPGGRFEAFLEGPSATGPPANIHGERSVVIPAGTLKPDTDHFGYIRRIKIVGEATNYEHVRAIAGYVSVTKFELSTKTPMLSCPAVSLGGGSYWIGEKNGDPKPLQEGIELPEVVTIEASLSESSRLQFGRESQLEMHQGTVASIDGSGETQDRIVIQLQNGRVDIAVSDLDALGSGVLARMAEVEILLGAGSVSIEHHEETGASTVSALETGVAFQLLDDSMQTIELAAGERWEAPEASSVPSDAPSLRIDLRADGALEITWESASDLWKLVSATRLDAGVAWSPVAEAVARDGDSSSVILEGRSEAEQFFRLSR